MSEFKDITGKKFGKLTAIKFVKMNRHKRAVWQFRCDCGKIKDMISNNVVKGTAKSCGCGRKGPPVLNLAGNRYGKMVAIKIVEKGKWLCRCDCGRERIVNRASLRRGAIYSCGCIRRLPSGEPSRNQLFSQMRFGAKRRNLKWEIALDEFAFITSQNCFYCGSPPKILHVVRDDLVGYVFNGIDRVNNKLGYIPGNIVPCCKFCNIAKNDNAIEDFKNWVNSICSHWASK